MYDADYFQRDIPENWFSKYGLLRPDQLAAFCYTFGLPFWGNEELKPRQPKLVYSIGCGTGVLESFMEQFTDVIGVDPMDGAKQLYKGKRIQDTYQGGGDTIIFCESIEHIPEEEIKRILDLVPNGARVVIVNWLAYHPLPTNGWDHITPIDDKFFDDISNGWEVLVRRHSHLVMER